MSGLTRGIEPGLSLLSSADVRVVIHPVGQLPRDVLDGYIDIINKFKHVSLSASRSFYRDPPTKTPFQYLDWSTGYMHFLFTQADQCRRRSRLTDLHRQRQVVAAIGLVYCPLTPSIPHAYEEFTKACKAQYPEALVQRCFVVEPSEEQLKQAASSNIRDMVMFPPGSQAHFQQHLEVWMHELAALVLGELERWVLSTTTLDNRANSSYADSPDFTGSNAVIEEMAKRLALSDDEVRDKKRWARLTKAKGDACFMAGTPQDALEHYRSCAEICRVSNDLVWYGAAIEGIAAARLMLASLNAHTTALPACSTGPNSGPLTPAPFTGGPSGQSQPQPSHLQPSVLSGNGSGVVGPEHGTQSSAGPSTVARKMATSGYTPQLFWRAVRGSGVETEVRDLLTDARAAYKRRGGCTSLVVEQHLKLIRLAVGVKGVSGARKEVLDLATTVLEMIPSLHSPEDRITTLVEMAQVAGCMGCLRRRTLMLWQALDIGRSLPTPAPHAPQLAPSTPHAHPSPAMERGELLHLAAAALQPPEELIDMGGPPTPPSDQLQGLSRRLSGPLGRFGAIRSLLGQQASVAGAPAGRADCWLPPSLRAALGPVGSPTGVWDVIRLGLLEASLTAARVAGVGPDVWEAAAALLRDHHLGMSLALQGNLLEVMGSASAASPPYARIRRGLGPPLVAIIRRVLPHPPALLAARLSLAGSGRLTLPGTGTGKGGNQTGASPFIFSAVAAGKKQAASTAEHPRPEWVCGEECFIEVSLTNPLLVPLRLDKLHAIMTFTPPGSTPMDLSRQQTTHTTPPTRANSTHLQATNTNTSSELTPSINNRASLDSMPSGSMQQPPWTPSLTSVLLAPRSKPTRLVLSGRPTQPGTYTLTSISMSMSGASWVQPFQAHYTSGALPAPAQQQQPLPPLPPLPSGRGRDAAQPAAGPVVVPLQVLPALPLLTASLQGTDVCITAPGDGELGAPQSGSGTGNLVLKSEVVHVFEGQVATWKLTLSNNSATGCSITHLNISVVNAKGIPLKPLLQGAHAGNGLVGPHLEVSDTALSAFLPLAAGRSMTLPVSVHVGRLHKKQVLEESLEVRINYASVPPSGSPSPDEMHVLRGNDDEGGLGRVGGPGQGTRVLGRRLMLPVVFRIQAALQVSHITFAEYFSPLRNGVRCTRPHINVKAPSGPTNPPSSAMEQAMHLVSTSHPSFLSTASPGVPVRGGHRAQRSHALIGTGGAQGPAVPGSARMYALDLSTSRKLSLSSSFKSAHRSIEPGVGDTDLEGTQEVDLLTPTDTPQSRVTIDGPSGGAYRTSSYSQTEDDIFSRPPFLALKPSSIAMLGRSSSSVFSRSALGGMSSMIANGLDAPRSMDEGSLRMGTPGAGSVGTPDQGKGLEASQWAASAGTGWQERGQQGVGLAHDCIMMLVVYNDSDRYFRVWVGQVGGGGPEGEVVLSPRGSATLWAHLQADTPLQRHIWSNSGNGPVKSSPAGSLPLLPPEVDRMAAAEALAMRWALCYQLIHGDDDGQQQQQPSGGGAGGGGAGGQGHTRSLAIGRTSQPYGMVRLAAVDAACSLTSACSSLVVPAPVHFHIEAIIPSIRGSNVAPHTPGVSRSSGSGVNSLPIRLRDLSRQVTDTGGLVGAAGGELWGLQIHTGTMLDVQLMAVNQSGVPLHVQYSVSVASAADAIAARAAASGNQNQHLPETNSFMAWGAGAAAPGVGPMDVHNHVLCGVGGDIGSWQSGKGVLVVGAAHSCHALVLPGQPYTARLQLVCVQAGFYQVYVTHVMAAPVQIPNQRTGRVSEPGMAGTGAGAGVTGSTRTSSAGSSQPGGAGPEGEGMTGGVSAEMAWHHLGPQLQLQLELGLLPTAAPMQSVYASTDKLNLLVVTPNASTQ